MERILPTGNSLADSTAVKIFDQPVNNLCYADDAVLLAKDPAALQTLLNSKSGCSVTVSFELYTPCVQSLNTPCIDGLVKGEDIQERKNVIAASKAEFEITVQENPSTYLEIQICITTQGISLKQEKYAREVVERFDMNNAKNVNVLLAKQSKQVV